MKRLVLLLLNLSDYVIDATRDRTTTCLRRHVSACESWVLHFQVFFSCDWDCRRIPYMKWKYQQWQTSTRPVENENEKIEKLNCLIASGEIKSIDHSVAGRSSHQSRVQHGTIKRFHIHSLFDESKTKDKITILFFFTNFAVCFSCATSRHCISPIVANDWRDAIKVGIVEAE